MSNKTKTPQTADDISEALRQEITTMVDTRTLDAGLSLSAAARIYKDIIVECRERADCLEHEAGLDSDDDNDE